MFLFCSLCNIHDIDVIIESGTANGCSTRILVNNFPNKKIYTIEFTTQGDGNGYPDFCKEAKKYNNITLINGDSFDKIPELMNMIDKKSKVAILIDGPKDNLSLLLYYKLTKYNNIKFMCIHDVDKCWGTVNYNIRQINGFNMITSENIYFRNNFKDLDQEYVTEEYKEKYNNGPGLGLIFNNGYNIFHVFIIYIYHIFRFLEKIYLRKIKKRL